MSKTSPRFNKEALRQFARISTPFFRSEQRGKAFGMLCLLVILTFGVSGVNVLRNYASGDIWTAFNNKNSAKVYESIYWYLATLGLAVPLAVYYRFTEEKLALRWRQWLTNYLLKKYFFRRRYYTLQWTPDIDNPDQRIAEDIKNFSATTLSFLLLTLNSIITIVAFIGVLSRISSTLVFVLFSYAVIGTVGTFIIGKRLVRLFFRQYKREATFRYGLIRVRDHAESIAFFRGEPREKIELQKRFLSVVENTVRIIGWNRNLAFFTTSYNFISLIIPIMVVSPLYLSGKVELGAINQAVGAFAEVLAATSILITQFERLSGYTAAVTRLGSLWDAVNGRDLKEEEEDIETIDHQETESSLILDKVTVRTPDGSKTLLNEVSFRLQQGKSILIMGESGAGKSSLLRTIAGLWTTGTGGIKRPRLQEMMFLPQKPYMVPGNLRAQLMYPSRETYGQDDELKKILAKVNLEKIVERVAGNMNYALDWGNVLSLGEQQRVSFARALYKKPKIIFLDEGTSALDEENESHLYSTMREERFTFISVGHRSTLKKFHDLLLEVKKDGSWKISPLPEE